ncbi:hypothetical protein V8D89_011671 [Ganoderma adspersum]
MSEPTTQTSTPVRSPPPEYAHALHLTPLGDMLAGIASSPEHPNTVPIDVSSFLLPEHLRLTRKNWAAYKLVIPILCALRGVDDHLRNGRPDGRVPNKKWEEDDTLCKAIILFNIKHRSFFERDSVLAHSDDASQIWNGLVSTHEEQTAASASSAKLASMIVGATTVFGMGCMVVFSRLNS